MDRLNQLKLLCEDSEGEIGGEGHIELRRRRGKREGEREREGERGRGGGGVGGEEECAYDDPLSNHHHKAAYIPCTS